MIDDDLTLDAALYRIKELEDENLDLRCEVERLTRSLEDANQRVLIALDDCWGNREYRE